MFLINFPLMLIPFAVYNFFVIAGDSDPWNDAAFSFTTGSGAVFTATLGVALALLALFFLLVEALKSRCLEISTTTDHILSFCVLLAYGAEFYYFDRAATPTFFLLGAITLVSLIASFLLSGRRPSRLKIDR
jgi:hypothetical protein